MAGCLCLTRGSSENPEILHRRNHWRRRQVEVSGIPGESKRSHYWPMTIPRSLGTGLKHLGWSWSWDQPLLHNPESLDWNFLWRCYDDSGMPAENFGFLTFSRCRCEIEPPPVSICLMPAVASVYGDRGTWLHHQGLIEIDNAVFWEGLVQAPPGGAHRDYSLRQVGCGNTSWAPPAHDMVESTMRTPVLGHHGNLFLSSDWILDSEYLDSSLSFLEKHRKD